MYIVFNHLKTCSTLYASKFQHCASGPSTCHLKSIIRNNSLRRTVNLFKEVSRNQRKEAQPHIFYKALFAGSVAITVKVCQGSLVAKCEATLSHPIKTPLEVHDRLEGTETLSDKTEPTFNFSKFLQLLAPQWHYFLAAVASAMVVALSNIKIPFLLGEVVNVVAEFTRNNTDATRSFKDEIWEPAVKIFKMYIVQSIFTFSYITFLTKMGEAIANDMRQQLFVSLIQQDMAFYDTHKTGELVNRLTSDVQDFKSSYKMCISQGLRSVTQIIGCGISMYQMSPQLAGVTAVVVPTVIAVGTLLGSFLRTLSKAAQNQVAKATGVADECLGNMRTVRAFAMEDEETRLFYREIEKSREINEHLGFGIGLFQAGSNLFLNGIVLGTLYIGGSLVTTNQLQPGDLMSFLVASQTIQKSLGQMSVLFGYFVRGMSAGARVFEYIDMKSTIPVKSGKIIPHHSLIGEVQFHNVCFSYPTRPDQMVLENFNLTVPTGSMVAIVGASGGGKSTLAQLLERFYDVTDGSITIDGQDLRELDPSWIRGRLIGFINQEPVLFATSVMENIRYGRPSATDKEVMEAAKISNAHDFIENFPEGYNTIVGERGAAVSGGQKQRIAIARALLKDPTILVLDEATSALDAESEAIVQNALEKCIQGRTVIVIAHRLSTIKNANVIAVMSKGKLAEIGTHADLRSRGGIYASLIQQQEKETPQKSSWGL